MVMHTFTDSGYHSERESSFNLKFVYSTANFTYCHLNWSWDNSVYVSTQEVQVYEWDVPSQ